MRDAAFSLPSLMEVLHHRASTEGDATAYSFLWDDGVRDVITNAQLDHRARSIGRHLQESDLSGQCIVLLYPPGLEFIAAFLGCLYAGSVAVPAYPPRPKRPVTRLKGILADSRARAVLTCSEFDAHVAEWINTDPDLGDLQWIRSDRISREPIDAWTAHHVSPDSLALLQYTSGSTGAPKGVMITHRNLMHNLSAIHEGFDIDRAGMGVSWLPIYHDMGLVGGVLQPLFAGGPVTLLSPISFLRQPLRWLQAIDQFGGTISGGPNFAYEMCVDRITPEQRDQLDLSEWRTAYCGAEPIRWQTLERFGEFFAPCGFRMEAFYPCFGMAESTLMVTGGDANSAPCVLSADKSDLQEHIVTITPHGTNRSTVSLVGCGRGLLGQEVAIVDPESREVQDDCRVGEIWVRGHSVAKGYWNRTELTQDTFQGRLAGDDQGTFLRTGDLGFVHDSELYVTGRLKDLIIIRGRNHYPQDIEQTVETCHESLRPMGCAAFGVEVDDEEHLVVVQEVQRGVRKSDYETFLDTIREAVVREHEIQPHTVVLVKTLSIPKTSSGKVQRRATRQQYLDGALSELDRFSAAPLRPASVPHTETSQGAKAPMAVTAAAIQGWLAGAVAERLGEIADRIDVHRPFEALGLDSLAAVRLIGDLETWLDRTVSPTLIYECSDIASLAAHLASEHTARIAVDPEMPQRFAEPIAIVGMACRFPGGADDPESFWRLMAEGVDAIGEVPVDRWDVNALYDADPNAAGKMSTRWGGFIDGVDRFDPQFFGIAPREAHSMDPQQRLLLEVAWEALENAGLSPARLAGTSTGVFTGICNDDYSRLMQAGGKRSQIDAYYGTGCAFSVAAGRLSYVLGLQGPSLPVDTACSSSLVAVHLACQSLSRGECQTALVGGVNLLLSPDAMIYFSKVRAMAADGRCKTFDSTADGYVRGEGCGVVVLKRLSAAIRDGDRILATIRGTAVNHDGSSNGLTAPNPVSQERVIRQALAVAGIEPHEIGYIEAHGTGTPLGDPVEMRALNAVFSADRDSRSKLQIASVKTNIGHLEAAAGIAGLIKTVLSLRHREIPAHLHLRQVNPQIPLDQMPVSIPTQLTPWRSAGRRRMAGVSSFGFSGTNAHVILEEAPEFTAAPRPVERPAHVLTLSAKSEASLKELVDRYISHLQGDGPISLTDLCHTAGVGRSHFPHRLAVPATSVAQLSEQLTAIAARQRNAGVHRGQAARSAPRVALVFSDQRTLAPTIWRELYETQPAFRDLIDRCDDIHLQASLVNVVTGEHDDGRSPASTGSIWSAMFACQYALAQMWRGWGVEPCVVAGNGVGELVAACVAGMLSLEDALRLTAAAGDLQTAGGSARDGGSVDFSFVGILSTIDFGEPTIPVASCQTGRLIEPKALRSGDRWLQYLRNPKTPDVNLETLAIEGCEFAIDMGLAAAPSENATSQETVRLASLDSQTGHWSVLLNSLAQLYVAGVDIDWPGFDRGYTHRRLTLPNYPFQRERYWFDVPTHDTAAVETPLPFGNGNGKEDTNGSGNRKENSNGNGKPLRKPKDPLPQQIRSAGPALRPGLISVYLKQQLAAELGVDETDVGADLPLSEMGLDSLMTMGVIISIKEDLDFNVYPREVYAHPTVATLAEYMAVELDRSNDVRAADAETNNTASPKTPSPMAHPVLAKPSLSGEPVKDAVFLLSAPRSGSTLLRVMLAGHTQLFSPPELHLLPFDHMGQRRELLSDSYLGEGLTRALMELQGIGVEDATEQIAAWADQKTPVDQIYRILADAAGSRHLVDKSPTYAGRTEILQRAETWFESPKYVLLMRHPLAVIESLVRMRIDKLVGNGSENPYLWAEEVWRTANRNVTDFFEKIDAQRRIVLRYESLVTNPSSEMGRLAEFLQVPYDDALLTPYAGSRMTDAASGGAAPIDDPNFLTHRGVDASLAEAWRKVSLPQPLAADTRELAQRLEYDVAPAGTSVAVPPKTKQTPQTGQTPAVAAPSRRKDQRPPRSISKNGSSMRETFTDANGLRLCVCTWGPADGPVVLCLHGILDQGISWQLVAGRLVQHGYRIIAPDFRGHGRSEHVGAGCSYHFLDFVSDADAVLRTLGDEPVSLAGHSLGAVVAAQLAMARPDRIGDLTVIEPPLHRNTTSQEQQRLTAYLDYTATPPIHQHLADIQAAADRLRRATPGMSEKLARDLARRSTKETSEGWQWRWDARLKTRSGLAHAANQFTREAFCGLIGDLTMPVTLVQGTDGMTKLNVQTKDVERHAVTCVTVDGGHQLTIQAPDQVAEAIAGAADPDRDGRVTLQRCSV